MSMVPATKTTKTAKPAKTAKTNYSGQNSVGGKLGTVGGAPGSSSHCPQLPTNRILPRITCFGCSAGLAVLVVLVAGTMLMNRSVHEEVDCGSLPPSLPPEPISRNSPTGLLAAP